jgi:hypothetical protein
MSMGIIEFLESRIAEDEARATSGWARLGDSRWDTTNYGQDFLTPSAVLAECAAKRKMLAKIPRMSDTYDELGGTSLYVLACLASVYKDHPGYLQEWAL